MSANRYSPLQIALHWIVAAILFALFWIGFVELGAQRTALLRWHMAGGMAVLALTAIRFLVRPRGTTRAHLTLYLLVALMAISGFATTVLTGLNAQVFGAPAGTAIVVPPSPGWTAHYIIGIALALFSLSHGVSSIKQIRRMTFK